MTGAKRPIREPDLGRCAGVLLVVLLAHLAFMATPFHADAMHVPASEAGADGMAWPEAMSHDARAAFNGEGSVADCAIAWHLPASGPSIHALAGPALPTQVPCPDGHAGTLRPFPRSIGPPLLADFQALLQVFRM